MCAVVDVGRKCGRGGEEGGGLVRTNDFVCVDMNERKLADGGVLCVALPDQLWQSVGHPRLDAVGG